jgi:hypothetical protein
MTALQMTPLLAREGVMFTRAIAQVPLTAPSHTGQPPLTCVAWRGDWTGGAAHKSHHCGLSGGPCAGTGNGRTLSLMSVLKSLKSE